MFALLALNPGKPTRVNEVKRTRCQETVWIRVQWDDLVVKLTIRNRLIGGTDSIYFWPIF